MVFEGLDRLIHSVAPVVMRGYELIRHVVEFDLFLELVGAFVVENMFCGEKATCI